MAAEQTNVGAAFLTSALARFRAQKKLAERAIEQLSDEQLHQAIESRTNSVAVIMQHMAGNMRSRWTDLLTSDGEKPWRHRDREFVDHVGSRKELMSMWERGWSCVVLALEGLEPDDLTRTVPIRGWLHTVIDAALRQLDHYGYHVGQIILLARVLAKDNWTTLTIPPGESEDFNRRMWQP